MDTDLIRWLLEGDPSIRWQVQHDLLDDPAAAVEDRRKVSREGWGARLLEVQDSEGTWAKALYSPKWTSTTYTLLLLYRMGLEPAHQRAQQGVEVLIERARRIDGGLTFAKTIKEPETCITGMVVLLASYFGVDSPHVREATKWLLDEQMPDGGWNCEKLRSGATHGSFHTSIMVLEALIESAQANPDPRIAAAIEGGHHFFLDHRLYHSHRTGAVVDPAFTKFSFPPYWHFDALRGLDHFRAAGAARHDALSDAIDLLESRRRDDGRWPLQNVHRNSTWFTMEPGGKPSRWNTLRALRVLQWWER